MNDLVPARTYDMVWGFASDDAGDEKGVGKQSVARANPISIVRTGLNLSGYENDGGS